MTQTLKVERGRVDASNVHCVGDADLILSLLVTLGHRAPLGKTSH